MSGEPITDEEKSWQENKDETSSVVRYWTDSMNRIRKSHLIASDTIIYKDENSNAHRLVGPAVIYKNRKSWYYHGTRLDVQSQEEFERVLKLKVFW